MGFKEAADETFQLWHHQKGTPDKHGGQLIIHRGELWGGSVQSCKTSKRPLLFQMIDGKMYNTTKVKCNAYAAGRASLTSLDDRLYIGFCTNDDNNKIYLGYNNAPNIKGWTRLPVPNPPFPIHPNLTICAYDGLIYLVVVNESTNKLYWGRCHLQPPAIKNHTFFSWNLVPNQQTHHAATLCTFKSALYLLTTLPSGRGISYCPFIPTLTKFAPPKTWSYTGTITSSPSATIYHQKKMWIMFRGPDTLVKYTTFDGMDWTDVKFIKDSQCIGDQSIGTQNGYIYFAFEELKEEKVKKNMNTVVEENNEKEKFVMVSEVPGEESDDDFNYEKKQQLQGSDGRKQNRWFKKVSCF